MTNRENRPQKGEIFQRFEAKYLISEVEAAQILDYIEPYVEMDPNAGPEGAYTIDSVYLDSPDMRLFTSSEMGEKNRFKLRVRCYGDSENAFAYCEIKQRIDQIIIKKRARVRRDQLDGLLDLNAVVVPGEDMPCPEWQLPALDEFRHLMKALDARPCVAVRYERQAFMSNREEPVRVTLDRYLACTPSRSCDQAFGHDPAPFWYTVPAVPVILEIKFTNGFPRWIGRLIERFDLLRTSIAKYVYCVKELQSPGILMAGEFLPV